VHDPIATGRRAALRAVAVQAIVALLVAVGILLSAGLEAGLAAAAGGIAMLAGNALAAVVALGGGIQPASAAFARLMLGTLGKWVVVVAVLAVALGVLGLPALPILVGLAAGMLAYLLALHGIKSKRQQR
jgi:F0F1-type ATP synthase assembly protein I